MPGRSYTSALLRSLEYQGMERDGETDLVSFELRSMCKLPQSSATHH